MLPWWSLVRVTAAVFPNSCAAAGQEGLGSVQGYPMNKSVPRSPGSLVEGTQTCQAAGVPLCHVSSACPLRRARGAQAPCTPAVAAGGTGCTQGSRAGAAPGASGGWQQAPSRAQAAAER